jgi:hypothetical protein
VGIVAATSPAGGSQWTLLIVAALGSSALGAIIGGFITTWLRGRIEREEAWRTRLLDSASVLGTELSELMLSAGKIVHAVEKRRAPEAGGIEEVKLAWNRVRTALTPVQILFGHQSKAARHANGVLHSIRDMWRAAEGEMDRVASLPAGLTVESDPAEAVDAYFKEATESFGEFAAAVHQQLRLSPERGRERRLASRWSMSRTKPPPA